jgi:hypothetical protein
MVEDTLPAFEDTEEIPSANQSETLPAFEDTEELSDIPSQKSSVPSEVKGAGIGALVGAIPGLTAEITGVLSEAAAKKRSPYTPEQLQFLSNEYEKLKAIKPEETMAKVGEQFSKQNRIINELEKEAYTNLSEPITRQEYQQAVVRSSMPFTREVDVTTPEFLKTAEQATPKLQTINPIAKQEADQLEKFAVKKASEIIQNKRNASLGTIPEEQLLQEYNVLKEQIKQTKEGFAFKPNMEKAIQDYNKELEESASVKEFGKKTAMEKLESPLAKQFPELKGRLYSSAFADVEKDVANILDKYKPGETLKGEDAYKLVRDIRQAVFAKDGTLKLGEDAAKAAQRAIRDLVGSKNPEASNLFQEMSQKISDLKKLEKTGYMKRDTKLSKEAPEFIQFGQKEQKKIIQDIAPNLYKSGIDVSGDVAARLGELKKTLPDDLYKELELAVLKIAMEDPKKAATLSNFDLALATVSPQFSGIKYGGKLISSPTGSLQAYRAGKALQKIAKPLGTIGAIAGGVLGGPLGAFAGEVAQEATDVEPSGATPNMPEYWLERGVRNPEEQVQRARLSSFKQGLPEAPSEIPSRFEAPEVRQRKEQVLAAKKAGALAPTYVEAPKMQVLKADNPAEIASIAQALQLGQDKASQEYGRVLSQIIDAPAREKESILFGLNQQPAFRELVRKAKGEQNTEEETPLMLRGPA